MIRQSSFTRRIIISKNIDQVFGAWSIQGAAESWFLQSANFERKEEPLKKGEQVKTGDLYKWVWHSWPDNIQSGVITKCIPNEVFAFTFDPAGHVEIVFRPMNFDKTEVVLTQSEILTVEDSWYDYYLGCGLGWSFWLINLKAYLEHGITLNEKDIIYTDLRHSQMVNQ